MSSNIRVAIIVNPSLELGVLANTVTAIGIGIGAKFNQLANRQLTDLNGQTIDISADRPVPILQASQPIINSIMTKAAAHSEPRATVVFPAFARSFHTYSAYELEFSNRDLTAEIIDGIGLAGPEKWIKSITGSLKLLR